MHPSRILFEPLFQVEVEKLLTLQQLFKSRSNLKNVTAIQYRFSEF